MKPPHQHYPTVVLILLMIIALCLPLQAFQFSWSFGRNVVKARDSQLVLRSAVKPHANYITERNQLLLDQIVNATKSTKNEGDNIKEIILPWMNFYDESFDHFLSQQISLSTEKETKDFYGKIRYEINVERQQQLLKAQELFKVIISYNDIKEMEAKLLYHLSRNEIQLPFLMILEMNLENAIVNKGSENIIQLLSYLRAFITEYQDKLVSNPVKLLRQLLRFESDEDRRNLLSKRILISSSSQSSKPPSSSKSSSDQCEFIVSSVSLQDDEVAADVTIPELEDAINVVEQQVLFNIQHTDFFVVLSNLLISWKNY